MVRLRLLGGISLDGERAALAGRAAQRHRLALLGLLGAAHPRAVSRDRIVGLLWPERETGRARNLLSQAVHALRRALGTEAILSVGDGLRLNPRVVSVDVGLFEEALETGALQRAVDLYGGPFMDGFFLSTSPEFDHWLDGSRERLRQAYVHAMAGCGDDALARGSQQDAGTWWRRLVAEEPHNARWTIRLMESLVATGDRAGALRQARLHAERLRADFEAEPDPEVVALGERIKGDAGAAAPAVTHAAAGSGRPVPTIRPPPRPAATRWRSRLGLAATLGVLGVVGWGVLAAPAPDTTSLHRIAVLPLANLTGDSAEDYFVAAMHEALIAELARVPALTVMSRQSVLRYRDSDTPLPVIARELGVGSVVEGSVFRAGDSVRITAQLVRGAPEAHLWSSVYQGGVGDVLGLQAETARAIARAVHVRLAPAAPGRLADAGSASPEAQEAYFRGLYHLRRQAATLGPVGSRLEALRSAIRSLEDAVARDPGWAAAHAGLAEAYHWLASSFRLAHAAEYFPKAKAAALRALELDHTESRAWASLGFVRYQYEWDWAGADDAIRRALALDPNSHHHTYALYLEAVGRHEDALRHYHQAEARDPLSVVLKRHIAMAYSCAGRHEEAIAQLRELETRLEASGPSEHAAPLVWDFMLAYLRAGMVPEAVTVVERHAASTSGRETSLVGLAYVYAHAGRHDEARDLLARFDERGNGGRPAHLLAALGETDRALAMVEEAFERVPSAFAHFRCTDTYRALAHEPRMQEIMGQLRFPS